MEGSAVSRRKVTRMLKGTKGQIAFGLIFFFLAGLAFSGFALDAGMILYRRSQLQNIAECSALTGADMMIRARNSGKNEQTAWGEAEQIVRELVAVQCANRGLNLQALDVNPDWPDNQDPSTRVLVDAKIKNDLLLSKFATIFVPDVREHFFWTDVSSTAGTSRRPVILSLLIDTTGSMTDPISAAITKTKIEAAREAAVAVIDALDIPQDQIAIIGYAERAYLVQEMTTVKGKENALKSKINALGASGSTNMADAIVMGRKQVEGATMQAGTDYRRIVLLFTDGIPNTGIARFPYPKYGTNAFGNNESFFLDFTKTGSPPKEVFFRNGSLSSTSYSDNPPGFFQGWDPILRQTTGVYAPFQEGPGNVGNTGVPVWCLEKWVYLDSKGEEVIGLTSWNNPSLTPPASIGESDLDYAAGHIYMDMAIREADIVKDISHDRKQGVTFYAVGVGPVIAVDDLGDPYQHAAGEKPVREIFLRKLANDENAAFDHEFIPETSNLNSQQLKGRFYHTRTAEQIRDSFVEIINQELGVVKLVDRAPKKP